MAFSNYQFDTTETLRGMQNVEPGVSLSKIVERFAKRISLILQISGAARREKDKYHFAAHAPR